jgi:steroid delta-isomerase-like uncharacterized protein
MSDPSESGTRTARRGPTTVARAYFKALSEHDLDAAEALWKPGCIDRAVGMFEFPVPSAEFRRWFGGLFAAIPDITFDVLTVTAQKESAAVRYVVRGTFDGTGTFEGLTPNGATADVEGCDVLTVRDGLIVENHGYLNGADIARQLGALPPRGSGAEKAMTAALNARTVAAKKLRELRDR